MCITTTSKKYPEQHDDIPNGPLCILTSAMKVACAIYQLNLIITPFGVSMQRIISRLDRYIEPEDVRKFVSVLISEGIIIERGGAHRIAPVAFGRIRDLYERYWKAMP